MGEKQMINSKQKYLEPFNCVQKMSSATFQNFIYKTSLQIMFNIYV